MIPPPNLSSFTDFSRRADSFIQVTYSVEVDDAQAQKTTHVWKTIEHPTFTARITLNPSTVNTTNFFGICILHEKEQEEGSGKETQLAVHAVLAEDQKSIILTPQGFASPVTWYLRVEKALDRPFR